MGDGSLSYTVAGSRAYFRFIGASLVSPAEGSWLSSVLIRFFSDPVASYSSTSSLRVKCLLVFVGLCLPVHILSRGVEKHDEYMGAVQEGCIFRRKVVITVRLVYLWLQYRVRDSSRGILVLHIMNLGQSCCESGCKMSDVVIQVEQYSAACTRKEKTDGNCPVPFLY